MNYDNAGNYALAVFFLIVFVVLIVYKYKQAKYEREHPTRQIKPGDILVDKVWGEFWNKIEIVKVRDYYVLFRKVRSDGKSNEDPIIQTSSIVRLQDNYIFIEDYKT